MRTTIQIMNDYINERLAQSEKAKLDSGLVGKAFELGVRSYIMHRSVKNVKTANKTDIRFTYNGKRYNCEIKSACGELNGTEKAAYVIYCAEVDVNDYVEYQARVFTAEQWREFLEGYNGRGNFLKYDSKRGKYHIQSFRSEGRPTASVPMRNYIDEVLFELPDLEEFFGRG